jgi:hypothetical protein
MLSFHDISAANEKFQAYLKVLYQNKTLKETKITGFTAEIQMSEILTSTKD